MTTAITTPTIPLLIYQVNTGTMTYTFPPWTESHGTCTPFTFSAFDIITLSLPTFITLTSATRTFSLLSTNDADSAIYDIQIDGALTYVSSKHDVLTGSQTYLLCFINHCHSITTSGLLSWWSYGDGLVSSICRVTLFKRNYIYSFFRRWISSSSFRYIWSSNDQVYVLNIRQCKC